MQYLGIHMYQKGKRSHSFPSLLPVLSLAFLTFRGSGMCHVSCNGPAILIIPMEKEAYVSHINVLLVGAGPELARYCRRNKIFAPIC